MKAASKRTLVPEKRPAEVPWWHRQWLAMALLCAVTLLAYANSFGSGFVLDNRGILLEDPRIRAATSENLALILQHTYWWPYGESGLYRPFTTLTYLFNYVILGNTNHPAGYHWINFFLHAGNVLLVYFVARRLVHEFRLAMWIAAVWAVHPVLTESVTNMVGRADLLSAMALLSGFLIYLRSSEAQGWRRWAWLTGLLVVTLIGVFSKESAAAILGVIVLYELAWWKQHRQVRALMAGCVTVMLALAVMAYARRLVFGSLPLTQFPYWDNPQVDASFWTARLTALKVMAKCLGLLVWPAHLSCDYSYAQIPLATGAVLDWLAWLAVAAAAFLMALMFRWNRPLFFLACVGFAVFLPSSNLLFPVGTIMAERALYVPAIALAAALVLGCDSLARRTGTDKLKPIVLGVIVASFTARTLVRNGDWQDSLSLMRSAVAVSPDSYKTHKLMAAALYESDPGHSNIDSVIAEAEKSIAILNPVADWHNNPDTYLVAGGYYLAKGDAIGATQEGIRVCRRSLELLLRARAIVKASLNQDDSRVAELERTISTAQLHVGNLNEAMAAAVEAQRLDPLNANSYRQLARVLLADGRADEAAVALAEGALVTSDMGLRQELLRLYQDGLDAKGCATTAGPYGPAINPSCETVRRHLCAASNQALQLYTRMGNTELAEKMKAGIGQLECANGSIP